MLNIYEIWCLAYRGFKKTIAGKLAPIAAVMPVAALIMQFSKAFERKAGRVFFCC